MTVMELAESRRAVRQKPPPCHLGSQSEVSLTKSKQTWTSLDGAFMIVIVGDERYRVNRLKV